MTSFIGRIKTLKNLFLEKLDLLIVRTEGIELATNATLESTTASLEAHAHQVDHLNRFNFSQEGFFERLAAQQRYQAEELRQKESELLAVLEKLVTRQDQLFQLFESKQTHSDTVVGSKIAESAELELMAYLYNFLPCRTALDASAGSGEAAAQLLAAGFKVWAFEAEPAAFKRLNPLIEKSGSQLYGESLIGQEGAAGWSLTALQSAGKLPAQLGLVRLTLQQLLPSIADLRSCPYPVVAVHWQASETAAVNASTLVTDMRAEGYHWYLGLYAKEPYAETAFYSNRLQPIDCDRCTLFFFDHAALFSEAYRWCQAVLPTTYFR